MPGRPSDAEVRELVSHVMGLRMDFIRQLLSSAGVSHSGLHKHELRERLMTAIDTGKLSIEQVIEHLTRLEPGAKQHVFLMRPPASLNKEWRDRPSILKRLRTNTQVAAVIDEPTPLLMPDELTLSALEVSDGMVEIAAVEARSYIERAEEYDQTGVTAEGRPLVVRAYVEQIARSAVRLRWNTRDRHAALHITQATGRGTRSDHYNDVRGRFGIAVKEFLDLSVFAAVDLHKVIHKLGELEQTGQARTRTRRGAWDLISGAELTATSSSTSASVFDDPTLTSAIKPVATLHTGKTGNLWWLPDASGLLAEPLHLNLVAPDSRVHFMVPSTPDIVDHVINEIRALL